VHRSSVLQHGAADESDATDSAVKHQGSCCGNAAGSRALHQARKGGGAQFDWITKLGVEAPLAVNGLLTLSGALSGWR
jgi:hypothetical protein